nr:retrovirus-related Pol polyprotein from transposon TNT 1-94 [Tanacetum cinerariifolium]
MFWTEAVSTACYVLNRVSITNPHNKTPYELLPGKVPNIRHLKPFGCQVTILNTSDHLGKFKGKANDGFLVGYFAHSKAYRVYNLSSKKVEEMVNLRYLEDKPNVQGTNDTNILVGTPTDDSDSECNEQVILVPSFPSNSFLGPTVQDVSAPMDNNLDYVEELARLQRQEYEAHSTAAKHDKNFRRSLVPAGDIVSTCGVPAGSDPAGGIVPTGGVPAGSDHASGVVSTGRALADSSVPASAVSAGSIPASSVPVDEVLTGSLISTDSAASSVPAASVFVPAIVLTDYVTKSLLPPGHSLGSCAHTTRFPSPSDLGNHKHSAGIFSSSSYDDEFCADVTNLDSNVAVDPVATRRINLFILIIRYLEIYSPQCRQGVPCRSPNLVKVHLSAMFSIKIEQIMLIIYIVSLPVSSLNKNLVVWQTLLRILIGWLLCKRKCNSSTISKYGNLYLCLLGRLQSAPNGF